MNIDDMIEEVLKKEGGYVNHKLDKGGATNLGITQDTLSNYIKRRASIQEVKSLTREMAARIYKENYYFAHKIDKLPEIIQPILFDVSVNSGGSRAVKMLQQILFDLNYPIGLADGVIGAKTVKYSKEWVDTVGSHAINTIVEYRKKFYRKIIDANPSQVAFEKGWMARANSFIVKV